ncbi:MAG: hypothetical protein WCO89_06295 [Syntrophus sp. (in: bacteria)]
MSVCKQLADFYCQVKARAPGNYESFTDLVGPDLIWVDDEYLKTQPRIAIIGQQVLGWDYTYPEFINNWEVVDAIDEYRKFDYGVRYYSTPFWRFFHQVRTLQHGPNAGQRTVLWTNLVKFVSADENSILGKPYREAALALQDDVLITELRLTTPDICIFLTGPEYDSIIDRYYPGIKYHALNAPVRAFAKLEHPDLPKHSYRCYHPKYLSIGGYWESTINTLSKELGWP